VLSGVPVVTTDRRPIVARSPRITPTLGQPLLSDREAAALLGVSRTSVRRLRYRGLLPFLHVGGSARIRPEDLAAYVDRQMINA